MNDLEQILKTKAKEKIEIPHKFENTIKYTLKEKTKNTWSYRMKKLTTVFASIIVVAIASISVYAAVGGEIMGKPVFEWINIKFPNEYEDYVVLEEQILNKGETKLNLISKTCDDGIVVLEIDLTLSDEDKNTLKLDEESFSYINGLLSPVETMPVISFNNDIKKEGGNTRIDGLNNFNIIIDGEKYWIRPRSAQSVTKTAENQYKVYQLYFLTEKELETKTNFVIELQDVAIRGWGNACVSMDGNFRIDLSKDKAVQNTTIITPDCESAVYKEMTKTVEKVMITPLQIIVKVKSVINDVSLASLESTKNKNYIGINEFKAKNQNGNDLECLRYETKRTVIYEDGTIEEWEQGDIGTWKDFYNAQIILEEYVIIEKNEETKIIEITPTVREPINGTEETVELNKFIINLR